MNNRTITLIHACLIIITVAASFYPVISNGFISLDDNVMLYENEKVFELSCASIGKYFTGIHWGLYHPLVLLSYALEFKFFKLDPVVYHTTNLYLHLFNCLLVYWLFLLLTGKNWKAFIVALLFASHPLHVESVAWIAERKDVLYAFFYLGSAVSYAYYLNKGRMTRYYHIALLLFVLSLLSKPMAVSLPLLLLLFDVMMTGRLSVAGIKEKAPFFLIAFVFAFLAILGQKPYQPLSGPFFIDFFHRCLEANYAAMLYFYRTFLLVKYSIWYSYYIENSTLIKGYLWFSPLLSSVLVALIIYSLKYTRKLLYGALFFGITLLPASNLIHFGIGLPGDRYMYVPILGFCYAFAEAAFWFFERIQHRKVVFVSTVAALSLIAATLCVLTNKSCRLWKDTFSLYSDIIRNYPGMPNSKHIYTTLAFIYLERRDIKNALKFNEKAYELDNSNPDYYWFKSYLSYNNEKDYEKALGYIDKAVSLQKKPLYYFHKIKILHKMKKYDLALSLTDKITGTEKYASTGNMLRGEIYFDMKDYEKALEACTTALEKNPYNSNAYVTRSRAYAKLGQPQKAAEDLDKAAKAESIHVLVGISSANGPTDGQTP